MWWSHVQAWGHLRGWLNDRTDLAWEAGVPMSQVQKAGVGGLPSCSVEDNAHSNINIQDTKENNELNEGGNREE